MYQGQTFGANNAFLSSPVQSQYLQSPQGPQGGMPQQFQQSPNYQNPTIQSPQQFQQQPQFGSPQQQQPALPQQYQQPQYIPQQIPQAKPIQQQLPIQQQAPILPVTSQPYIPVQTSSPVTVRPTIPVQPVQTIQPISIKPVQIQPVVPVQIQPVAVQPVTVQPQTQVQEFRHIERPLQVITVDEIEAPWRLKCATLERQILELQIQIRKNNGTIIEESVQEVQDDTKVKNLELQKLELEQKIHDDEQQLNEMRARLEELQQEYEVIITEKISYASNEVETWMKKYDKLEKDYAASRQKVSELKRQLQQLESADKLAQEQRKVEARSEVRRSSKLV